MIKKIIKHLLGGTILMTSMITSLTCCSNNEDKKSFLSYINIDLPSSYIEIYENETFQSENIVVSCFDNNHQQIEAETKIILSNSDGTCLPSWICLEDNKIVIRENNKSCTLKLNVYGQDCATHTTKSETKQIDICIKQKELLPPQNIEIISEKQSYTKFFGREENIKLDIKATRDKTQEDLISKSCIWKITNIIGPKNESDIFSLNYNDEFSLILISNKTDESYAGTYILTIFAQSILNSQATDKINIMINLVDGLNFCDENGLVKYRRKDYDQSWEVSWVLPETTALTTIRANIYDCPVVSIADNLCSKSSIKKISFIDLPKTIISIGKEAFANQAYLYNVNLSNVKYVNDKAFYGCNNLKLTNTDNEPNLEYVGYQAFYGCKKLNITIKQSLSYIGDEAFASSNLLSLNIGQNIEYIGNNAFSNCSSLTEIYISNPKPPILGGCLYYGSTPLISIKVPNLYFDSYIDNQQWSYYRGTILGI